MSAIVRFIKAFKTRLVGLLALALAVYFVAIACSDSGSAPTGSVGIPPEEAVDYIHAALSASRATYVVHVVNRVQTLGGKANETGVLPVAVTEGWQETDGIPLPAQMFRLGYEAASELAEERGLDFSYSFISPWYINDNHAPKDAFEKLATDAIVATARPYKGEREIDGRRFFTALYPDIVFAEACITCHNNHPVHLERYPDKKFALGDVMGGIIINLPLGEGG